VRKKEKAENIPTENLTNTGRIDVDSVRVEGVARLAHIGSASDRRSNSRAAHAVCSAT